MSKSVALLLVLVFLTASFIVVVKPVRASSATANSWETKAPMPEAIGGVKAVAVNGKIYVIGGGANFEYNPDTDNWTTKKPMPTPRVSFGIAVYQNKIYTIGGWNFNNGNPLYYSVNEVYDPSTDTWQSRQPMPTSKFQLDANVVNGQIYLIGGRIGTNEPNSTVSSNYVYNVANDSWTTREPMPYPVVSYASAVTGGKIYIMGGQDEYLRDSMNVAFTQIYDLMADTWSQGAPMLSTVLDAAAGATTGLMAPERIYLFGGNLCTLGYTDLRGNNITQVYDPKNNVWTYGTSMPTARFGLTVAVIDDTFYAIGGSRILNTPYVTSNEQYIPLGYGTILPKISLISPVNQTYNDSSVPLVFSLDRQVNWIGYSFDRGPNETIIGNTTITNLTNGVHNITVYANDTFGNIVASQTVSFTIAKESKEPEPFPTTLVLASVITVAVVGVGLLVYFKKRKRSQNP